MTEGLTGEEALAALVAAADVTKVVEMAAYHRVGRRYLGLGNPGIDALVAGWRAGASVRERVALAGALWDSDVHEARIAAGKLLTQARIPQDEPLVWDEFLRWVPSFDAWAIADQACKVGERRLVARPERLDSAEAWTRHPSMWVRRAALVATLPWAKLTHPSSAEIAARERVLGWAADYMADREWFIQKAVGWWLRTLSGHDPERVRAFLDGPGHGLKGFARPEATRRTTGKKASHSGTPVK